MAHCGGSGSGPHAPNIACCRSDHRLVIHTHLSPKASHHTSACEKKMEKKELVSVALSSMLWIEFWGLLHGKIYRLEQGNGRTGCRVTEDGIRSREVLLPVRQETVKRMGLVCRKVVQRKKCICGNLPGLEDMVTSKANWLGHLSAGP